MIHKDGTIQTDKMVLATVLILHGYHPVMEPRGKKIVWIVPVNEVDEFAEELLEDFVHGAVRVEPVRFARELKAVREGVYKALNHNGTKGTRVNRG